MCTIGLSLYLSNHKYVLIVDQFFWQAKAVWASLLEMLTSHVHVQLLRSVVSEFRCIYTLHTICTYVDEELILIGIGWDWGRAPPCRRGASGGPSDAALTAEPIAPLQRYRRSTTGRFAGAPARWQPWRRLVTRHGEERTLTPRTSNSSHGR